MLVTEDRLVFLRERANFLYSPLAYYFSKIAASIPISMIPMSLMSCIVYFSLNLNPISGYKFWVFVGIMNLAYFLSSIYALFLASLSKNQQVLSALSVVSYIIYAI